MKFMDSKGQGFDVFKLLIAAVVAGAILVILLNVIGLLPDIGSQKPNAAAANAVKTSVTDIGSPNVFGVTFNSKDSLAARSISEQSRGLSDEQICVFLGPDIPNASSFKESAVVGRAVDYIGATPQKTSLIVMCDRSNKLQESLTDHGYTTGFDVAAKCGANFNSSSSSRYCIVAVISDQ